jgi:nitrate reductase molybdenum cofactor assembly chaperone NarJ/NarW
MSARTTIERLALLFQYPDRDFTTRFAEALESAEGEPGEAKAALAAFAEGVAGLGTEELQELYTRTFDLNPMCTLEIGWQLYGEDYHRGEFLVKVRQQLREYGLPESGELPDHMTHALALLARLDSEEAKEFAGQYVLPAIDKMLSGWRDNRNGYAALLESVFAYLKRRYSYVPVRAVAPNPELPVLQ